MNIYLENVYFFGLSDICHTLSSPVNLPCRCPSSGALIGWRVCPSEPVVLPPILPGESQAVPLHLTSWRLQARPKGLGLFFCKVPIHWTSVEKPAEVSSSKRECQSTDFDDHPKRSFRYRAGSVGRPRIGLGEREHDLQLGAWS